MWVFVFFDLPVITTKERKIASQFRKKIMADGFTMLQYSVYIRHCASRESMDVHIKRVESIIPEKGHISVLAITDKQYSDIINFIGVKTKPLHQGPKQLELF